MCVPARSLKQSVLVVHHAVDLVLVGNSVGIGLAEPALAGGAQQALVPRLPGDQGADEPDRLDGPTDLGRTRVQSLQHRPGEPDLDRRVPDGHPAPRDNPRCRLAGLPGAVFLPAPAAGRRQLARCCGERDCLRLRRESLQLHRHASQQWRGAVRHVGRAARLREPVSATEDEVASQAQPVRPGRAHRPLHAEYHQLHENALEPGCLPDP